jgi:NAD(P)-dependent dehydrogenase (short-subunit alcohol dehydrogenase family)
MANQLLASKGQLKDSFQQQFSACLKGIRLNAVIPGIVKTELVDDFFKNLSDEQKKAFEGSYPLGLGDPLDVANLIEYLLSDKAKWITGECYKIHGGHMIRKA